MHISARQPSGDDLLNADRCASQPGRPKDVSNVPSRALAAQLPARKAAPVRRLCERECVHGGAPFSRIAASGMVGRLPRTHASLVLWIEKLASRIIEPWVPIGRHGSSVPYSMPSATTMVIAAAVSHAAIDGTQRATTANALLPARVRPLTARSSYRVVQDFRRTRLVRRPTCCHRSISSSKAFTPISVGS